MKKIKKMLAVLSSITVLTGMVGMTAYAGSEKLEISESEMKQVNQALEEYAKRWNNSEIYDKKEEVDSDKVYKSHLIKGFIIDEYAMAEDFDSLISDEINIFAESGNQLVTIIEEEDGKLKAIGSMLLNDGEELINFNAEAEKIIKQEKEEISDIKIVKSYLLRFDLIYYQTKDGEFVVPYFESDYETISSTIENGKVYTADEFVGRLNCIYDLANHDPNSNGGVKLRETALEYTGDNFLVVGDANFDYSVDVRDCAYIANMLASNKNYMLKRICDYNLDGVINIRDVASLANSMKTKSYPDNLIYGIK